MKIVADENIPFVEECFSSIGQVKTFPGREITPGVVADTDILLVRSVTPVNEDLLAGNRVKFVGTATIGFEHIDIDYLKDSNIGFASAPGSNANSAAEYVIAALLEIGQKHNINLEGKSVGIIGVGNVGSRVAKKCDALGMKVYLNDPPLQRQTGDSKYLPIEELYDCDFITFHTPLTFEGPDKTFHLADEKFFKSLKSGCIFINTSRGSVVDSNALKKTTKSGKLKAVILDVWENEPNIDMELLRIVDIGTPHIAGYSLDGKVAGMIMIYKATCEYFGLNTKFDVEDFLPEPSVPRIKIKPTSGGEQDMLLNAVRQIYDIRKDDVKLRQILSGPKETKGRFFDGLRKDYHVRREFQNTQIILATENRLTSKRLLDKLAGIGFEIENAKS
jgi:erythronate-4-phosphate dehydrogenase